MRAYGLTGHRHISELVQELRSAGSTPDANPGARERGLPAPSRAHAARHPGRQPRATHARGRHRASCATSTRDAYADEPFVQVVDEPPATSQVRGSNFARVHVHLDERTGRIVVISVIDNLVKGAAGQAIQAFNLVHGLPETAGLEQLPLAP